LATTRSTVFERKVRLDTGSTFTWDVTMTSCRAETETVSRLYVEKTGPFYCCCSQQSVASPCAISLFVSEFPLDILSTFCVKLMLSKLLHLWFLLFDYFVYRQNIGLTYLKRFIRCGHYCRWGAIHNHRCTRNNSQITIAKIIRLAAVLWLTVC